MKIEILGTGCTKCKALEEAVKKAVAQIGGFHEVKKVEDIVEIMNYGVMSTPALVVDGVVKSAGKLLSIDEIINLLKENSG
ncbi:thioredoxin family protein [Aliarcobacter cryaerophilus]|uniref:thioredoxin family protein n=1 Tax=Aliarcobacter cryaerophilus TaxID=28198 RepID=UPI0021B6C1AC|nr:thioredoxin family protein [Aliarcobacter cryaerophilus]MCT7538908.1 thioredoxin family protein [Aliarcobacter cryaerophilus]